MTRPLTAVANQAINAQETGEVFLWIVQITHPSLAVPICVTENTQPITYNGTVYQPFPFTIHLPDELDNTIPDGILVIDNVDQSIETALAGLTTPATCNVGLILASNPNVSLLNNNQLIPFKVKATKIDQVNITASLSLDIPYNEPLGGDYFNPKNNPRLFTSL